jgi:hypothetical protein
LGACAFREKTRTPTAHPGAVNGLVRERIKEQSGVELVKIPATFAWITTRPPPRDGAILNEPDRNQHVSF